MITTEKKNGFDFDCHIFPSKAPLRGESCNSSVVSVKPQPGTMFVFLNTLVGIQDAKKGSLSRTDMWPSVTAYATTKEIRFDFPFTFRHAFEESSTDVLHRRFTLLDIPQYRLIGG